MNVDEPILTPKELLAYRRATKTLQDFPPPETVIFIPQKSLAKYILRRYFTKQIKGFLGEFYLLRKYKGKIAFSTGFGLGAPVVAGLTDEFCALGVKQFFIIGMAGGLQPNLQTGSLVLSSGAIRGEGVSRHYLHKNEIVESNTKLLEGFSQSLHAKSHAHSIGVTWTTDVPFREMKSQVNAYQNRGILAVDMEAAAMLSVAESNSRSGLAAFSISDSLADGKWSMLKDLSPAQNGLFILFEALIDFLSK
ncbi:MAG: nucleoside phosphorylase [Anaerolineales bacterium]|nr:nucleoside phosphorylase [Anaerolineales bacterium]